MLNNKLKKSKSMNIIMVVDMKDNGKETNAMVKELSHGQVVLYIQESSKMTSVTETEECNTQTVQNITENGKMMLVMEKVYSYGQVMLVDTKATLEMIKCMVKAV